MLWDELESREGSLKYEVESTIDEKVMWNNQHQAGSVDVLKMF